MKRLFAAACLASLFIAPALPAAEWSRDTTTGAHISVDPNTGKATVATPEGAQVPLWDGVHQLDDGTTVRVESGIVIPDEQMVRSRRYPWRAPVLPRAAAACEDLQRKVCGFNGECAGEDACNLATQLRTLAREEEAEIPPGSPATLPHQCLEALQSDNLFPRCKRAFDVLDTGPCASLVARVCGERQRCGTSEACSAARQLQAMEREERLNNANPAAPTYTTGQCGKALLDDRFFRECGG